MSNLDQFILHSPKQSKLALQQKQNKLLSSIEGVVEGESLIERGSLLAALLSRRGGWEGVRAQSESTFLLENSQPRF